MFSHIFRPRGPVAVQSPRQDSGSKTRNTIYSDKRTSTGSEVSITDVEAGFLAGQRSKREQWKNTLLLNALLAKLRRTPSNDSDPDGKPSKRSRRPFCTNILLGVVLLGVTIAFLILEISRHSSHPQNGVELISSRWGLPSPSTQQALTTWPTSFTRDINPLPCHSHNDYWRRVPLYDALSAGCTGVEADVWFDPRSPNDLFVGHTRRSLTSARTLKSLYIDPLLTILNNQNAASNFSAITSLTNDTTNDTNTENSPSQNNNNNNNAKIGVFDTAPTQSLTLLIDLKTPSSNTFPAVLAAIQPLLAAGYLTTYSPTTNLLTPGPITIVATGNTDFAADILSPGNTAPVRSIFFDAPLPSLSTDDPTAQDMLYNTTNSYYASVSFEREIGKQVFGMMTPEQVWKVRRQVEGARRRGLVSRYWDADGGRSRGEREEGVWKVLVREGVGRLNVDDLEGGREFLGGWEGGRGR